MKILNFFFSFFALSFAMLCVFNRIFFVFFFLIIIILIFFSFHQSARISPGSLFFSDRKSLPTHTHTRNRNHEKPEKIYNNNNNNKEIGIREKKSEREDI
jgi:hypothetical protein